MRKSNQWEIIRTVYDALRVDPAFPRLGLEYGIHAGRIDPCSFIKCVKRIAPHIKETSIDRHRRKLERQWPSNQEVI